MKINIQELRKLVGQAITEAKAKKPPRAKIKENEVRVDAHIADPKLDFSKPLGGLNTYRQQGQANFGPYTGDIDSVIAGVTGFNLEAPLYGTNLYGMREEAQVRLAVRAMIAEALRPDPASAWAPLAPSSPKVANGIWEAAMHWYDFQGRNLGQVREEHDPKNDGEKKPAKARKTAGKK